MNEFLKKHPWKIAIALGAIGGAVFGLAIEGPDVGAALGGAIFWATAVAAVWWAWVTSSKLVDAWPRLFDAWKALLFGAWKALTKS